jgi:predicted RNA-binding protein with PUA-like domain
MNCWLVKQEPSDYAWDDFVRDGRTAWTGVRNFAARNHLRSMHKGDEVLFYHSGEGREIVGVAKVLQAAYADPTTNEGDWSCVDLAPVKRLSKPVTLATIKADAVLREMPLVRQSRLSVMPVSAAQFQRVLALASRK